MSSHMVRAEDRHLKSWWGDPKNIYIYFSSSIFQEVSEEWMEGEREGTQKEKEEKGERGKEEETNKQGYVTTAHNLAQKCSPHMPKTEFY